MKYCCSGLDAHISIDSHTATSGLRYFSTHTLRARAFARVLQFENLTIDCNPMVVEGESASPITKASKVSNFRR